MGQNRKVFQLRLEGSSIMIKLSKFAKICGVSVDLIQSVVSKENIITRRLPMQHLDTNQQNIIARILYFEGKIEFLTYESKINL
jgi:hypothetical protein